MAIFRWLRLPNSACELTAKQGRTVITKVEVEADSGCEFDCRICHQGFPGDRVLAIAESWRWWRPREITFECLQCREHPDEFLLSFSHE